MYKENTSYYSFLSYRIDLNKLYKKRDVSICEETNKKQWTRVLPDTNFWYMFTSIIKILIVNNFVHIVVGLTTLKSDRFKKKLIANKSIYFLWCKSLLFLQRSPSYTLKKTPTLVTVFHMFSDLPFFYFWKRLIQ